jgi:hypothetical protein
MRPPRGKSAAALIALYAAAAMILAWLALREFGSSRFEDCMSVRAFSRAQCEDYARE